MASDAVQDLHRTVAAHAAGRDWRIAAHHHWAAGDRDDARAIIDASARSIIGRGEYLVAAPFVADVDDEALRASFLVVLSRRDFKQGDVRQALARAKRAVEIDPGSDVALANLASLNLTSGDVVGAVEAATRLIAATTDEGWLGIAQTMLAIVQGSRDGPIPDTIRQLSDLAERQRLAGDTHFEGITYLNLAVTERSMGDAEATIVSATKAIDLLESSSGGAEVASARCVLAWALFHLGDSNLARAELAQSLAETNETIRIDTLLESGGYGGVLRQSVGRRRLHRGTPNHWPRGEMGRADECRDIRVPSSEARAISRSCGDRLRHRPGRIDRFLTDTKPMSWQFGLTLRSSAAYLGRLQAVELAKRHAAHQSAGLWAGYCDAIELLRHE